MTASARAGETRTGVLRADVPGTGVPRAGIVPIAEHPAC